MCNPQFLLFVKLPWQSVHTYNLFAWWQFMWSCKSGSLIVLSQYLQFTDWTILWNIHKWRWRYFLGVKHLVQNPHENTMTADYVIKRAFDTLPLIAPWWNISHRWWFAHYWLDNMESIDIGYVTQNHFILITCGYYFIVTSVATYVWFLTQDDFWYMIFIEKNSTEVTNDHG